MGKYENFLQLYITYNNELLFGDNSIRPAKSITRNIITGVEPFEEYYKKNKRLSYSDNEVSSCILNLGTSNVTSTTRDNIRNMEELNFMIHKDNTCKLTRNFIDYLKSGITLREYILDQLRQISGLSDITMFYNCLLCVLREGLLYGEIINYPDSFPKFSKKVTKLIDRAEMCEKVDRTYGFLGPNGARFGYYTPNANYRILSTCVSLELIARDDTPNLYGFTKYYITQSGFRLLECIDRNIAKYNDSIAKIEKVEEERVSSQSSQGTSSSLYEDIYDRIYLSEISKF